MGWLEKKLIVVSVVVGFLYMSTLSFLCLRDIVRLRKSMELCSSCVRLSFMLLCILLIYVWMVCKLIFVVSNKTTLEIQLATAIAYGLASLNVIPGRHT
jgi:hypothetical protein